MRKKGFTLMELLIIIIIIGILAALFFPRLKAMRESAINQEAIAGLKLIRDAEKIYKMEWNTFTAAADVTEVNQRLKLSFPEGENRNWDYTISNATTTNFCACASRNLNDTDYARTWGITADDPEPICGESSCCGGVGNFCK